jgi:hypothetical protein
MAGHLRVPTAPFSHCHLPQWFFRPDFVRASPVDLLAFYFTVLALFPIVFCFCLFSLFFCFGFSLYCYFSVCFVCVLFLQLCRSPSCQFHHPPPIARLYSAPPRNEFQTYLSVVKVYLNVIGFPCILFFLVFVFPCISVVFFLVIMLLPRWFDWIPFGLDLCVVDMYVTLAFELKRKIGPDFYVVDECISYFNCQGG